jgi:hypothetical protein
MIGEYFEFDKCLDRNKKYARRKAVFILKLDARKESRSEESHHSREGPFQV